MLVPCGTACTLPPVAGLLRSVLVPSGTAPTPTLSVLVPSGTAPPSYARCWFLAEPHPLPSIPPPSYAWCWFLAEPHPLLRPVAHPTKMLLPAPPSTPITISPEDMVSYSLQMARCKELTTSGDTGLEIFSKGKFDFFQRTFVGSWHSNWFDALYKWHGAKS